MVFPTYVQFCAQIAILYLFLAFSAAKFLADLKKSAQMISSSLSTVFQVTNNLSTSMIDYRFNRRKTKS